jgi:hypothetical protein
MYREIWADRKCERLQNPSSYNEGIRKSWMPFWTKNAAENYHKIKDVFMKENRDASILLSREHSDNVLLIGSGPSLNDWEPYFKDWKGDIICSSSHLAYFEALGIKPTFCFIIDADPNMSFLVSEADTKDITLVTHPNMDPVILAKWQGPIIYFRMHDPGDEFFREIMPMMYAEFADWETKETKPGVKAYVLNSGNVTNCQLAMANYWKYKRSFLCGVDLGFPKGEIENQYRFIGYKRTKDGFEREEPMPIPKERILFPGGGGIKTDQVSCFYKYSTMILWGMDNANIYSCSRGILREIPYISPADVVACQGDIPDSYVVPNEVKYRKAQKYLIYRGIYIMKGTPKITQKKTKNFERTKKRLMRYQILITKFKKQYNEKMRKHIIHTMYNSPALKFRFYLWEWTWTPEQTTKVRLSYTAINNKYSEKGWKRMKLVLRFHLGKLVKLW